MNRVYKSTVITELADMAAALRLRASQRGSVQFKERQEDEIKANAIEIAVEVLSYLSPKQVRAILNVCEAKRKQIGNGQVNMF